MKLAWRRAAPEDRVAERRLIKESRRLGETMTLMVGRMETLVERLHEELENHDLGSGSEGGSDERRI